MSELSINYPYRPLFRTAQHPTVTAPAQTAKDGGADTLAAVPEPEPEPIPKSPFRGGDDIAASHQRMADQLRRAGYDEAAVAIFLKRINRC